MIAALRSKKSFGVHGGHRVFEVEDGGQGGFQHQVAHTGGIGLADGGAAVDLDIKMQAVVLQQHRRRCSGVALVAGELGGVLQARGAAILQGHHQLTGFHAVAGGVLVRTGCQRRALVKHVAGELDHLGAAHRVVALALFGAIGLGDGIRAVQRVVQAAPAGVGCVQGIARIQDGHHQLGARLDGELVVHIGRGDLHVDGLGDQVADGFKKLAVGRHVGDRAGVGLVPGIELGLQAVTLGQQGDVAGGEIGHDGVKALPEGAALHAGAGQDLVFHEAEQGGGHLQAVNRGACGHGAMPNE